MRRLLAILLIALPLTAQVARSSGPSQNWKRLLAVIGAAKTSDTGTPALTADEIAILASLRFGDAAGQMSRTALRSVIAVDAARQTYEQTAGAIQQKLLPLLQQQAVARSVANNDLAASYDAQIKPLQEQLVDARNAFGDTVIAVVPKEVLRAMVLELVGMAIK